ncbi:MAG: ribonuclease P protein component [Chloroflexi bacterium]|nr:ribonuclease P protein component [Chloroflexota bacterium]
MIPRAHRLRRNADFTSVRNAARSHSTGPIQISALTRKPTSSVTCARIGIVVSRRVGNAVVRNLVRRRLRAALSALLPRVAERWDIVIGTRPSAASAPFEQLASALESGLRRAGVLTHPPARIDRTP